jgi:hypothetical protein
MNKKSLRKKKLNTVVEILYIIIKMTKIMNMKVRWMTINRTCKKIQHKIKKMDNNNKTKNDIGINNFFILFEIY